MVFHLDCAFTWLSKSLLSACLNGPLLCLFLGKVLFGEAAALEDDSESRSEASSPAFTGSSRGVAVASLPPCAGSYRCLSPASPGAPAPEAAVEPAAHYGQSGFWITCTWKRVCVCSHQMFAVVLGLGRFEVCAPCASLSRGWWVSHDLRGLGGGSGTKSCQRII